MIIKTKPVFKDKLWGGSRFQEMYQYLSSSSCGEAWGISTHKEGESIIQGGVYDGLSLSKVYQEHPELFGNLKGPFPILIKVIDANDDLSVQVHPSTAYANEHNVDPKTECWYILDAEEDSHLFIGHTLTTKADFEQAIKDNTLLDYCTKVPVKQGDFFYIKSGTLHAINKGIVLLEVQQSSDITYRVYDYNRLHNGSPRELHVDQALEVTTIPDTNLHTTPLNEYFTFEIITNETNHELESGSHGDYIFVINGSGMFDNQPVQAGDFIIVTASSNYQTHGSFTYAKATII